MAGSLLAGESWESFNCGPFSSFSFLLCFIHRRRFRAGWFIDFDQALPFEFNTNDQRCLLTRLPKFSLSQGPKRQLFIIAKSKSDTAHKSPFFLCLDNTNKKRRA